MTDICLDVSMRQADLLLKKVSYDKLCYPSKSGSNNIHNGFVSSYFSYTYCAVVHDFEMSYKINAPHWLLGTSVHLEVVKLKVT